MPTPDFVVVGHLARDIAPGGWTPGGTITFAAVQAHRLGLSVGVVTRAAHEVDVQTLLPFADVRQLPSDATTTFENEYAAGQRTQHVRARAAAMTCDDLPADWHDAPIALLGPLAGELPREFASQFEERSLVGVSAQGWLRSVDDEGRVRYRPWRDEPFWSGARVVFVSDEDLSDGEGQLEAWTRDVPIVVMTKSRQGSRVWADGGWRTMPAFPQQEVDPTGAGDTFATGFLIRLHETGDVADAARFGAAAASLCVGTQGTGGISSRREIEGVMQRHAGVALR